MKTITKILALLLVAVMLLPMFAACDNFNENDIITTDKENSKDEYEDEDEKNTTKSEETSEKMTSAEENSTSSVEEMTSNEEETPSTDEESTTVEEMISTEDETTTVEEATSTEEETTTVEETISTEEETTTVEEATSTEEETTTVEEATSTEKKTMETFEDASTEEKITSVDESDVTELSDGIPDYWLTALEEGAEAINTALCEAGSNKSAFLFYSDVHYNYGSKMSPTLLKYLYNHTGMTKTVFGGDIVNNEATDYETMSYLWEWRKQIKDLPNHHSVVGNHDDGNATNNLFSEEYVYGYLLAPEETSDIVRGEGMYYYIDNTPERTRYLYLDTAYQGVSTKQQEFVKEALLSAPEGWHIVAVSHIWYETNYADTTTVGELNSGASILLSMFDSYNSRSGDYADCGGWVEFCIGGHTHIDFDGRSTNGIPIILVETDSRHTRSGLTYTAGTTSEASVNGIIADYDNHKIVIVRIGRGESREVEIANYIVSYTNVLPLALAADGVSVYNDIGYKADTRWSNSSVTDFTVNGVYITGYIPISGGDTIYLKDITMPNSTETDCVVYFWGNDISGQALGAHNGTNLTAYNEAVWGEDGDLKQFTIPSNSNYKYIRIQCGGISEESVITINEPIE